MKFRDCRICSLTVGVSALAAEWIEILTVKGGKEGGLKVSALAAEWIEILCW